MTSCGRRLKNACMIATASPTMLWASSSVLFLLGFDLSKRLKNFVGILFQHLTTVSLSSRSSLRSSRTDLRRATATKFEVSSPASKSAKTESRLLVDECVRLSSEDDILFVRANNSGEHNNIAVWRPAIPGTYSCPRLKYMDYHDTKDIPIAADSSLDSCDEREHSSALRVLTS